MKENKAQKNDGSVVDFVKKVEPPRKREDSFKILEILKGVSGEEPAMWGESIIGFGDYHYKYKSGREGNYFLIGFSPRKQNLTLYIMPGFEIYTDLLAKLGKFKTGKSCLYINKLEDVDLAVLKDLASKSVQKMKKH